jgi:hypothetical protein
MSAKKRTSLDSVFGVVQPPAAGSPKKRSEKDKPEQPVRLAPVETQPQERAGESRRPNVKQHTAYLPLAVHEQLRKLAFEENRKMHDYLVEGLDRVFADRGLPAVKDLS